MKKKVESSQPNEGTVFKFNGGEPKEILQKFTVEHACMLEKNVKHYGVKRKKKWGAECYKSLQITGHMSSVFRWECVNVVVFLSHHIQ